MLHLPVALSTSRSVGWECWACVRMWEIPPSFVPFAFSWFAQWLYKNERRSELPWESIQSPGSWPAGCVWLLWLPVAFAVWFSVGIYRGCVCVLVCVICACLRVRVRVWACVCVVSLFCFSWPVLPIFLSLFFLFLLFLSGLFVL